MSCRLCCNVHYLCIYLNISCLLSLQFKADKIVATAKEEAVRTKAHAKEECEKTIADSHTQAERVWLPSSNFLVLLMQLNQVKNPFQV